MINGYVQNRGIFPFFDTTKSCHINLEAMFTAAVVIIALVSLVVVLLVGQIAYYELNTRDKD